MGKSHLMHLLMTLSNIYGKIYNEAEMSKKLKLKTISEDSLPC